MRRSLSLLFFVGVGLLPLEASAHWCSNIWVAPARLVVKPEQSTISIHSSGATVFRVYLQNNFPYQLQSVRMRGNAPGYSITVTPSSLDMLPGQKMGFRFSVTPSGGATGNVSVTSLSLQVNFEHGGTSGKGGWMGDSSCTLKENPTSTQLLKSAYTSGQSSGSCNQSQAGGLTLFTMAEKNPSLKLASGSPTFGRTGRQQLITLWAYRSCWNTGGSWACTSDNCGPFGSPAASCTKSTWTSTTQFSQQTMRAGIDVGRLKARALLGSDLSGARTAALHALDSPGSCSDADHCPATNICLAAVVGGYLWNDASNKSTYATALQNASNLPPGCRSAGLRVLDGSHQSSCTSGEWYERAACAAAEGLRGNYGPVKSVLLSGVGDNSYRKLFHGYLLSLVSTHVTRSGGTVPFYPDAGRPLVSDAGTTPPKDHGTTPIADHGMTPGGDHGTTPGGDHGTTPGSDQGALSAEGQGSPQSPSAGLVGGCSLGGGSSPALFVLFALVLLGALRRRRRRARSALTARH